MRYLNAWRARRAFDEGARQHAEERWQVAADAYRRAIAYDPGHADAHRNLAGALFKLDRVEEAAELYRATLLLDPGDPTTHLNLVRALQRLDRWEDALAAARGWAELIPDDRDARLGVLASLARLGRWNQIVAEYETGFAQESGGAGPASDGVRSLFVFCNDYGELVFAMSLLRGQALASGATFALPPKLYAANRDSLPVESRDYQSLEALVDLVYEKRPNVVFLMTGYLLSGHQILSTTEIRDLVRFLDACGCAVVTTDPLMRLAGGLTESDVHIDMGGPNSASSRAGIVELYGEMAEILADVPHIYPTDVSELGGHGENLPFFNPALVGYEGEATDGWGGFGPQRPETPPRWLFVIGAVDLYLQDADFGTNVVRPRLLDALRCGRVPLLIAPADLIEEVREHVPPAVQFVPTCSFVDFMGHLLDAEYAFYWNYYSCSILLRFVRGLPLFFFDRGHVSHVFRGFHELARGYYFKGWDRPHLEQHHELDPDHLARIAREETSRREGLLRPLTALPSPDQVLRRVLDG